MAWNAAGLDKTLRLDYNLDEHSVVLDVGGYEGQWASDCHCRYGCRIEVFEPVQQFADGIERRFERNPKVSVHRFGLAGGSRTVPLHVNGDRSSVLVQSEDLSAEAPQMVNLVGAEEFFRDAALESVDLMKINIEGGEYELLDHLVDTGLITRIRDVQVQFHDFVPDARAQMERLRGRLAATHAVTYQEDFIWENWRRKAS
jgi:FkbM family methyltransferase